MGVRDFLLLLTGAIINRVAGPLTAALGRAVRWVHRSMSLDHQSILRASYRNDHGGRSHIQLHIACAPARMWREPSRIDASRADPWVYKHFGEFFVNPDFYSPLELLRYSGKKLPSLDSYPNLNIRPYGLIEFALPITHELNDHEVLLNIVEIGIGINKFVTAIQDGAHQTVYEGRRRQRLDWFVNVSQALNVPEKGWVPWTGLRFPGREPGPKPSEMHFGPQGIGLAEHGLRGLPANTDATRICSEALKDLMERSGYRRIEEALMDSMAAIRAQYGK